MFFPSTLADSVLVEVFLEPVRRCADYKPAFGSSGNLGVSLEQFQDRYGEDLFYALLGLDSPVVYAAHKAAGGLTSVYRQLGIGCERVFRRVVMGALNLTPSRVTWSYSYVAQGRKVSSHTLDAKVLVGDLSSGDSARFAHWLTTSRTFLGGVGVSTEGAVFEVRQGYKSADSKRQNADLRFGMRAYQDKLLPVFALMSSQVSDPVVRRYRADKMLVLTGVAGGDPTTSTFAFFDQIVGYDLLAFFKRNSEVLKREVTTVVSQLLEAHD